MPLLRSLCSNVGSSLAVQYSKREVLYVLSFGAQSESCGGVINHSRKGYLKKGPSV